MLATTAVVFTLPVAAHAELGGSEASVQTDQQKLHGALRVQRNQAYAVHEIRTESNSVAREFVSPDGTVFAIAFHGNTPGESNALLGPYAAQIAQAMSAQKGRRHLSGAVTFRIGNIVYEASGHMRSYHIRAYLADRVPQGTGLEEIR